MGRVVVTQVAKDTEPDAFVIERYNEITSADLRNKTLQVFDASKKPFERPVYTWRFLLRFQARFRGMSTVLAIQIAAESLAVYTVDLKSP